MVKIGNDECPVCGKKSLYKYLMMIDGNEETIMACVDCEFNEIF